MRSSGLSARVAGILVLGVVGLTGRTGGRFELDLSRQELPEMGTVTRCLLSTDKGVYCFMPPFGWRMEVDSGEKRLNMTSPQNTLLTIRSIEPSVESKSQDSMRDAALTRYPDAKIIEEYLCYTEGASGRTFDLELNNSVGTKMLCRLTFVPINGEMIEFQLTAHSNRFRGDAATFSSLLTSFKVFPSADRVLQHAQQ